MANLTDPGFQIGPIYSLTVDKRTEFIPREAISFVSAEYRSQPGLLVIGALLLVAGILTLATGAEDANLFRSSGADPVIIAWAAMIIGAVLMFGYLGSRRVGITIASSGGSLFVESKGRSRNELLTRIHADLSAYRARGPDLASLS